MKNCQLTFPGKYLDQSYFLSIEQDATRSLRLLSSRLSPLQTIEISDEIEEIKSVNYIHSKNCYLVLLQLNNPFGNDEKKFQLMCLSFCFTKKNQVRLFPTFTRNLDLPEKSSPTVN